MGGRAARLVREGGPRDVDDRRGSDAVERKVGRLQLLVGAGRSPIQGEREPVGRPELAERERGPQGRVDDEPARVDSLRSQGAHEEPPETVVADARDDRRPHAQASESGADVAAEAADESLERLDVLERRARLQRVEVHVTRPRTKASTSFTRRARWRRARLPGAGVGIDHLDQLAEPFRAPPARGGPSDRAGPTADRQIARPARKPEAPPRHAAPSELPKRSWGTPFDRTTQGHGTIAVISRLSRSTSIAAAPRWMGTWAL